MRQGQQNRRGRGRSSSSSNNGRKHQNPLTRTFESSGPDVKIRGTPAHVAEKYVALARDALSSGDPVLAENYLQHAEHYNRIIMSFREQQAQQAEQQPRGRGGDDAQSRSGSGNEDGDETASAEGRPAINGHNGHEAPSGEGRARGGGDDAGEEDSSEASSGGRGGRGRAGRGRRQRGDRGASRGAEDDGDQQPDFLTRPIRRQSRDDDERDTANGKGADAPSSPAVTENAD